MKARHFPVSRNDSSPCWKKSCAKQRAWWMTPALPRLHIFFPDNHRALIATSDPHNSTAALNGIHRVSMAGDAPSRSYLKLAEAFEVFLDKKEQALWLKPGMTAVDLGAAPGGWTWQLVQRGLKVIAVDNGPLKGAAASHPSIKHLRQDGFRFRPQRPVDWLVCDMVEQPQRVAALMTEWFVGGLTQRAIFNLKLPMKKRVAALNDALNGMRTALNNKGIRYQLEAKTALPRPGRSDGIPGAQTLAGCFGPAQVYLIKALLTRAVNTYSSYVCADSVVRVSDSVTRRYRCSISIMFRLRCVTRPTMWL